jgi:hypothetical protein
LGECKFGKLTARQYAVSAPIRKVSRAPIKALIAFFVVLSLASVAIAAEVKPNWQAEWDRTVSAARRKAASTFIFTKATASSAQSRSCFQKKYPEINVGDARGRGNTLAPRIMAERRAGKFLVDAYVVGATTAYEVLYRGKMLDSVRAALILPEVVDESKWYLGQHHYVDPENRYILLYLGNVSEYVSYHTKSVEAGEIRSYWDFLQPKWKGKSSRAIRRFPAVSASVCVCFTTRRSWAEIYSAPLRRDGCHDYPRNASSNRLAG